MVWTEPGVTSAQSKPPGQSSRLSQRTPQKPDQHTLEVLQVAANSEGEIWLATRPHWINGGEGGIYRIDPKACAFVGDPIATTLPPSALTFY